MGLAPGWETKILHATQCGLKKKKNTAENRGGNYCFFLVSGHIYLHSPGNKELAETQARDQTVYKSWVIICICRQAGSSFFPYSSSILSQKLKIK